MPTGQAPQKTRWGDSADSRCYSIVEDCKLNLQKFSASAAFMEANENVSVNICVTRLMVPGLGNITQ